MIQRGGCGWPKMRRVTMSLQLFRNRASGGGASPWYWAGWGFRSSGSSSSPRGTVAGPENQQGDGAVLAPSEQHRHLVAVFEGVIVGLAPVAEGVEKLGEPPTVSRMSPVKISER